MQEVDLGGQDIRKEILTNFLEFLPCLTTINGEAFTKEEMDEIAQAKAEAAEAAKEAAQAAAENPPEEAPAEAEAEPENHEELDTDNDEEGKPKPKRFLTEDQFECMRFNFESLEEKDREEGLITKSEIKKLLRDLGDEFTNKLCNRMLSYSTANEDGKLDFEEFLKALVYVAPPPEEKKPEAEGEEGGE